MNLSFKWILITVTAISVVSDSILIPFYPQFFADVFNVADSQYVGFYLAVYCLVVMLAFPVWAAVAKRVSLLQLLVYTQLVAGVLSVLCYWATSLSLFWGLSLAMMLFKASYLLVYPYLLSLEAKHEHGTTIGVLAVVVEFGAIFGALIGGVMLQWFDARQAFLVMAAGDFIQMAVCFWLVTWGKEKMPSQANSVDEALAVEASQQSDLQTGTATMPMRGGTVFKISVVMLLFYFSAFLTYHFFTQYWSSFSIYDGELVSSVVFAIPAFMALLGLWFNQRSQKPLEVHTGLMSAVLLGAVGILLQGVQHEIWIVIGRCLFGWAIFQAIVRLDLLLFQLSSPETYATDYSKIRISQSLGVLLAAYAAGFIVAERGGQVMFIVSSVGLIITIIGFVYLFKTEIKASKEVAQST